MIKLTFNKKNEIIKYLCSQKSTDLPKKFLETVNDYIEKTKIPTPLGLVIEQANYIDVKNMFMDITDYFKRHFPNGEKIFIELFDGFKKNNIHNNPNLKKWELKIIMKFLENYDDELCHKSCNDTPEDILELIPENELVNIDRIYHKNNGDIEDHDPEYPCAHFQDDLLVSYLVSRIEAKYEKM